MSSSTNKTSTAANTPPSPSPKDADSFMPGPLTPQEIESLRQNMRESAAHSLAYFDKHIPHLKHKPS